MGRETFGYADGYDESANRYRGLRGGQQVSLMEGDSGLLVQSAVARVQLDAEVAEVNSKAAAVQDESNVVYASNESNARARDDIDHEIPSVQPTVFRRFHGSIELDPTRMGRDAGRIADEIVSHLTSLGGAKAKISLEIDIEIPNGIPQDRVRIVNENSNTLKFKGHNFEEA